METPGLGESHRDFPYWEVPFSCLVQVVAAGVPQSGKTQALDSVHQGPKPVTDLWYKSCNIENVSLAIGKSTMFVTEIRTNPFKCSCEKNGGFCNLTKDIKICHT